MITIAFIGILGIISIAFISILAIISTTLDAVLVWHNRRKQYRSTSAYEKYCQDHCLTYYWDSVKKTQDEKQANINYYENGLGKFIFTI